MTCIAPTCRELASSGKVFCATCGAAPAGKRGGWISAYKRRAALGAVAAPAASSSATTPDLYDASNVAPKLWVGAKPPADRSYPGVDVIVLCAAEYQPTRLPHFEGRLMHVPLRDDKLETDELRRALAAGVAVAKLLREGKRVLVTCQMGINRSALVAGLALGHLTHASADEIIALLRRKRDARCLYNVYFRDYLARYRPAVRR